MHSKQDGKNEMELTEKCKSLEENVEARRILFVLEISTTAGIQISNRRRLHSMCFVFVGASSKICVLHVGRTGHITTKIVKFVHLRVCSQMAKMAPKTDCKHRAQKLLIRQRESLQFSF